MGIQQLVQNEDIESQKPSKQITIEGNSGLNLTELQNTIKDEISNTESSSLDSLSEADEENYNNAGGLLKKKKKDTNFILQVKENKRMKKLQKRQKTNNSKNSRVNSEIKSESKSIIYLGILKSQNSSKSNSNNGMKPKHRVKLKESRKMMDFNNFNKGPEGNKDDSLSINSIDVSMSKRKVPKKFEDSSFDNLYGEKETPLKLDNRPSYEDEQLSYIEELQSKHDSVISGNSNHHRSALNKYKPPKIKSNIPIGKFESSNDTKPPGVVRKQNTSDSELANKRSMAGYLAAPPKSAFSRSRSQLEINDLRPTTANPVDYTEKLDENSEIGSIHSGIPRMKSNFELLRVGAPRLYLISKPARQVMQA